MNKIWVYVLSFLGALILGLTTYKSADAFGTWSCLETLPGDPGPTCEVREISTCPETPITYPDPGAEFWETHWVRVRYDYMGNAHDWRTYELKAPCKVYWDEDFPITAKVYSHFLTYYDWVSAAWDITDTGRTSGDSEEYDSGTDIFTTWDSATGKGLWSRSYTGHYVGPTWTLVEDHDIDWNFYDLGWGFHASSGGLNTGITIDPLRGGNTPPVVDAGTDIVIASADQNMTVITGTATDDEGDSLTYSWHSGGVLLYSGAVGLDGTAPLDLGGVGLLAVGDYDLVLTVDDGTDSSSDTVTLTVGNSPPVASPSGGGTYQVGTDLTLGGTVADYDGDVVAYGWSEGGVAIASGTVYTPFGGDPVSIPDEVIAGGLPLGSHTLTLTVDDGTVALHYDVTVDVIDTIAPTLAPVASPTILWPPNNKMVDVAIDVGAGDNSGGPVSLSVSITSNEDPKDPAVPDTEVVSVDESGGGHVALRLRSSRAGKGDGREYRVSIMATDESGNFSIAEVVVRAPHDKGRR